MTVRTYRLMEAHQRVDEALQMETRRRWPDMFKIMRLKKMKLAIKDRLARRSPRRLEWAS